MMFSILYGTLKALKKVLDDEETSRSINKRHTGRINQNELWQEKVNTICLILVKYLLVLVCLFVTVSHGSSSKR